MARHRRQNSEGDTTGLISWDKVQLKLKKGGTTLKQITKDLEVLEAMENNQIETCTGTVVVVYYATIVAIGRVLEENLTFGISCVLRMEGSYII